MLSVDIRDESGEVIRTVTMPDPRRLWCEQFNALPHDLHAEASPILLDDTPGEFS